MLKLKNIIKVEYVDVIKLSSVVIVSDKDVIVPADIIFNEIDIKKPCSCEISDAVESKTRLYTTKLVFQTCDDNIPKNGFVAYKVTTANKISYLIGTYDRPYPVVNSVDPFPSALTDSTLKTVTVTYKNTLPMLKVRD